LDWAKIYIAKGCPFDVLSFFVAMEIMSVYFSRFSRIGIFTCGFLLAGGLQLFGGEVISVEQSPAYAQNVARFNLGARVDDKIAEAALISNHPTVGYSLTDGRTDLVLSLSKIENIDIVSFLNNGTTGTVTVATSNSKLAVGSPQWHQIAKQDLTAKVTKIKVGPTEAKYVKFSFNVAKSGRIADLAVYSTASLTVANTALAGNGEGAVDGKDAKDFAGGKDAKDFAGGKEAKEVAEGPPEEGPPPNLPDPPPFVFVPEVSP
jgi:hypothetical protein